MNVLGLDFGGQFGYAVTSDGVTMLCGTADLRKRAKGLGCTIPTALYNFLRELIAAQTVSAVVWEDTVTSFMGAMTAAKGKSASRLGLGDALAAHAAYRAIVQLVADQLHIRSLGAVANGTLKKYATGDGRADKDAMIEAAKRMYRVDLRAEDHNAADACHLAAYGYSLARLPPVVKPDKAPRPRRVRGE